MKATTAVFLLLLSAVACQRSDEALRSAQSFVDEHYVTMDLPAAKQLTTGIATEKIAEEQHLIEGQTIDEATLKPRVHYKLLERRPEGDSRVSFLFQGEARVEELVFTRKWLVTVTREAEVWKVSNFQEFD
jgi:hypothetical protein